MKLGDLEKHINKQARFATKGVQTDGEELKKNKKRKKEEGSAVAAAAATAATTPPGNVTSEKTEETAPTKNAFLNSNIFWKLGCPKVIAKSIK